MATKTGPNNPVYGSKKMLVQHHAKCRDCAKEGTARNALAWAHNHVKYSGHRVDLVMGWTVGPPAEGDDE